ncbi:hypothetical protein CCHL11_03927 [Colletotrichum chlorophyti]|uniref:Uncharacterized protein n=1 Tax=Colletotrichum chlorophyti TaxID=708187 RepID=A0A1Q8RKT2_9PEZI|nr:hypothetical protein CCHL11_03927 [Colletotrichum chlorophyti]
MWSATGIVLGLCLSLASAIQVAKGSPCETLCGNVLDATTKDDIVCDEHSYSSAAGSVYSQCISCQLSSGYSTADQTDTQWLLYNLRWAVSYCVFGYPNNTNIGSSPCLTRQVHSTMRNVDGLQMITLNPLQRAIIYNELAPNSTEYDYCTDWDHTQTDRCASCLRAGVNNDYLTNFITILDAGCQQKPSPGNTISVEGSPFSKTRVNITDPTPTNSYVPNYDNGPINLGAKVGITIGGILLILSLAGFCVVWNGKRRRRAFLKKLDMKQKGPGWPTPLNTAVVNGTPLSQRPLRGWDDSPLSPHGEKTYPRYFSPYASQYNSPVSGNETPSMHWPANDAVPTGPAREIGIALGGDYSEQAWPEVKGKGKFESYEMREVDGDWDARQRHPSPPILQHPGHPTYAAHNPVAYHGMMEDDLKRDYRY